jgi:hypothetical protein
MSFFEFLVDEINYLKQMHLFKISKMVKNISGKEKYAFVQ